MTKPVQDIGIMLYLDGELSGAEAEAVEAFLEDNSDAGAKAQSLGQMGELLRGASELAADDAEDKLAALWGGIERGINANGESAKADVISFSEAQKKAEDKATEELVQKAGWFGGWQSHVATGFLAAAAVLLFMVATRDDSGSKSQETTASAQSNSGATDTNASDTQAVTPTIQPALLKSQAPEVENLEVYGGMGTVLTVEGDEESGDTSAVIWISNDTDVVEDPV